MKLTQQASAPATSSGLWAFPLSLPLKVHCENIKPLIQSRGEKLDNPHLDAALMQTHLEFGDGYDRFSRLSRRVPQRLVNAHSAPDRLTCP